MPACHLYVLPLFCEDMAKIGISVDPLARAQSFSARYYDCFDLARSLVARFEDVAGARRCETALHRRLREWNAPAPLTVAASAGGRTEWYRGAMSLVADALAGEAGQGHAVWAQALDWWRSRLRAQEALLYEWAEACLRDVAGDEPMPAQVWRRVVDVLDAWPALGLEIVHALPPAMARRYGLYRDALGSTLAG
jgi:hypothetical protein